MRSPDPIDHPLALEGLLRWYLAMGVDTPIDEVAHDRFVAPTGSPEERGRGEGKGTLPRGQAPAVTKSRVTPPLEPSASADTLIKNAEALAAGATTLEDLRDAFATLPGCNLAATASRMIFSGGTPGTPVMLMGGAPDTDDERQGEAFAGANGRLLDAMLRAIGLDRKTVYLANVIPWRPPGNRAPTPLELALCLPFTRRHIALAAPSLLVCLGEKAAQPLLDTKEPISRLRGRWMSHEGETTTVKTLVTFSPEYLMKQPLQKRRAWADLRMLAAEIG